MHKQSLLNSHKKKPGNKNKGIIARRGVARMSKIGLWKEAEKKKKEDEAEEEEEEEERGKCVCLWMPSGEEG